ncbi:MAG: phosphoribosylformylglycinamidine synthase subunit PurS [Acidobacteria bacterium]|nr:phosphoribosylformylglycinamidine synthase subunit PurS [Acidobacteriota bacterium]MCI0627360.1 phosphoribosylformylglycinamidine synthase subunit PurS [Acidobacteriota bacterium]MCI0723336.1 phosphoribosylformylglycinamidine synthase subunit PurS [Acidobacteriota bacterium]
MKARVFVSLKKSVLDPQGKTIHHSLQNLGYGNVEDVRQGKFFEIVLNSKLSPDEARREIEKMAKSVLTNPVIEEFRYEIDAGEVRA